MESCCPPPSSGQPSGVLIGCCPSSGSTLLSVLLDLHPQLFSGPELSLFAHPFVWSFSGKELSERMRFAQMGDPSQSPLRWDLRDGFVPYLGFGDLQNLSWYGVSREAWQHISDTAVSGAELADAILGRACRKAGKQIWCEKSPPNLYAAKSFLASFPEGRVLLLVRDGRDVVCSLSKRQLTTGEAAAIWLLENAIIRELASHPSVKVVSYENLVQSPLATLNEIASFLGVTPFTESMLEGLPGSRRSLQDASIKVAVWTSTPDQGIQTKSVGRWKSDLPEDDLALFVAHELTDKAAGLPFQPPLRACGVTDVLKAFGYDISPVAPKLSWERYFEYVLFDSHPFGALTQMARFHRNYVRLAPPMIQPSECISQTESTDIIESLVKQRIAAAADSSGLASLQSRGNDGSHDELNRVRQQLEEVRRRYEWTERRSLELESARNALTGELDALKGARDALQCELDNLLVRPEIRLSSKLRHAIQAMRGRQS